jgi:hypothetical protein
VRLTWKDAVTTALGALIVVMAFGILEGWGWFMLGSYRTGVLALAVVGLATCAVGGMTDTSEAPSFKGRFPSQILHLGVLVILLIGLILPSRAAVVAMAAVIVAQWAVATLRHALGAVPARRARTA